jgi:hypothetical protein
MADTGPDLSGAFIVAVDQWGNDPDTWHVRGERVSEADFHFAETEDEVKARRKGARSRWAWAVENGVVVPEKSPEGKAILFSLPEPEAEPSAEDTAYAEKAAESVRVQSLPAPPPEEATTAPQPERPAPAKAKE